jgi:hypothetical protein
VLFLRDRRTHCGEEQDGEQASGGAHQQLCLDRRRLTMECQSTTE